MSSASETAILELRKAGFSYAGNSPFIEDLSFSVGEGDFIGLLGANGSGKSTILKLACGILKPAAGNILLWGKELNTVDGRDRAKLISYLPQSLDISVPFLVRELVGMGLYPYDIRPAMSVEEALDMVGLSDKSDARLADLSGGERRRAFIAMTLLQGAGLLMLDEPLANLDIKYQIELVKLLKGLRSKRNIAVVMALHDINVALQFDKVMLLKDGGLIGTGRPDEVLNGSMLRRAFDVDIELRRSETEGAYISYAHNFRPEGRTGLE
jgi:ABC-type cobalamin/Fe3+-siderophores transport system ATPase subunit